MKNSKYNQVKNLRKTKNLLNEAAMDWKQSNGCYPSIGEFVQFINDSIGESVLFVNDFNANQEINHNVISQFANTLAILLESDEQFFRDRRRVDRGNAYANMTDEQFESEVKKLGPEMQENARKLRGEGQARKTGETKTTPPPASKGDERSARAEDLKQKAAAQEKARQQAASQAGSSTSAGSAASGQSQSSSSTSNFETGGPQDPKARAAWEAANKAERDRAARASSDDWWKKQQDRVRQQERARTASGTANPFKQGAQSPQPAATPTPATTGIGNKIIRGLKTLGLGLPVGIAAGIGQDVAGNIADELHAGPVTKTAAEIGGAYSGELAGIKGVDLTRRVIGMKPTGWKPSIPGAAGFVLGGKLMEPYGPFAQFGGALFGDVAGRTTPKLVKRVVPKIGKLGKIPFIGPAAAVAASLFTGDTSYADDILNPLSFFETGVANAPAAFHADPEENPFEYEAMLKGAEYSPVSARPQSKEEADIKRKLAQKAVDPSPKLPTPTMVPTEPLPEQPMDQAVREFRGTPKIINPVGTRTSRSTPLREGFDFGLGKYIGKTLTRAAIEALEKNLFKDAVKVAEKDLLKGAEKTTVITNPNTAGEIKIPTIHPMVKVEPKVEPVVKTEPIVKTEPAVKSGEIVKTDTKIETKPIEKTTQLDTPAPAAHTLPANKKSAAEIAKDVTKTILDIWKGAITPPKTENPFGGKPAADIVVKDETPPKGGPDIAVKDETPPKGGTDIVVKDETPPKGGTDIVVKDETPVKPVVKIDEPRPPRPTRVRITDPRPPYTRVPEPTEIKKKQEEPQVGIDFAPNERYGAKARRAFVDPYTRAIFSQEVSIQEEQTTQPNEMKPADRLKDIPVEERQKFPAAEMERYTANKREALIDPVTRKAITRKVQIAENKLSPQESLKRKTQKQKYKVVYVQDGKKVEVFASSIRGVRRVVYGKKQFRVHNSTGSDVTGYFKKLLGE